MENSGAGQLYNKSHKRANLTFSSLKDFYSFLSVREKKYLLYIHPLTQQLSAHLASSKRAALLLSNYSALCIGVYSQDVRLSNLEEDLEAMLS